MGPGQTQGGRWGRVAFTVVRWSLAGVIVYAYAIFLAGLADAPPAGWVTQQVKVGPVYTVGSGDSPIALYATDLAFVDVDNTFHQVNGLVVGNVPIQRSCDVTEVPPEYTTATSTTATVALGTVTLSLPPGQTLPPDFSVPPGVSVVTAPTTTSTLPKPTSNVISDPKKVCVDAITIRYARTNPGGPEVVGAKDIEIGGTALLLLIGVAIFGSLAVLMALGSATGYGTELPGKLGAAILYLVVGVGCFVAGAFIVKQFPVAAMGLAGPGLWCLGRSTTELRKRYLRLKPAHPGLPPSAPSGGPGAGGPIGPPAAPVPPAPQPYPPAPQPYPPAPQPYPSAPQPGPPPAPIGPWPGSQTQALPPPTAAPPATPAAPPPAPPSAPPPATTDGGELTEF